jgi:DNA-binding MarR family transcriptional regulator
MSELMHIFEDLARLKADLWNAAEERLRADSGLSVRYFLAMSAIGQLGACRVDDVAAELGISRRAAEELTGRIEADGCCRRCEQGGRAMRTLELTPRGQALVAEAGLALDDELAYRLGTMMPPSALAQFAVTLRRLRRPGISRAS